MKKVIVFIASVIIAACQGNNERLSEENQKENVTGSTDSSLKEYYSDEIRIDHPEAGTFISSPVSIKGRARGSWFFEAEFPVQLVNNGKIISQSIAKADSDWMTSDFVPFSATLEFPEVPSGEKAFLLFKNSNASGKPELDKSYRIPVSIGR